MNETYRLSEKQIEQRDESDRKRFRAEDQTDAGRWRCQLPPPGTLRQAAPRLTSHPYLNHRAQHSTAESEHRADKQMTAKPPSGGDSTTTPLTTQTRRNARRETLTQKPAC